MIFLKAFLIGGLICAIGQIVMDLTKLTPAKILVTFVVVGVFLSAVGLYKPIVDWAGSGASVPLIGFGHTLAKGTKTAIEQEGFLGILKGPLTAGAGGVTAAVLSAFVVSLFCRSKEK